MTTNLLRKIEGISATLAFADAIGAFGGDADVGGGVDGRESPVEGWGTLCWCDLLGRVPTSFWSPPALAWTGL